MSRTQSSFADRVSENMLSGQWSTPNPNPTRGSLRSLLTTWPLIYSNMLVYKYISAATQVLVPHSILCAEDYRKEIVWNNRFIRIDGKSIFFKSWYIEEYEFKTSSIHTIDSWHTRTSRTNSVSARLFSDYGGVIAAIPKNLERIATSWRIFCN